MRNSDRSMEGKRNGYAINPSRSASALDDYVHLLASFRFDLTVRSVVL